jgi:hypothetical protein
VSAHNKRADPVRHLRAEVEVRTRAPEQRKPTSGQAASTAGEKRARELALDKLERRVKQSADQKEVNLLIVEILRRGS